MRVRADWAGLVIGIWRGRGGSKPCLRVECSRGLAVALGSIGLGSQCAGGRPGLAPGWGARPAAQAAITACSRSRGQRAHVGPVRRRTTALFVRGL